MIDLYSFATGNGLRACIALAECDLEHNVHKVDPGIWGETKTPEFLALNPLGAIPIIVDHDGPGGKPLTLSQSSAILLYAAEKSDKFLPSDPARRALAFQWLMCATSDVAGTNSALFMVPPADPWRVGSTIDAFKNRMLTYFSHIDHRLGEEQFLAGEISVADLALYSFYAMRKTLIEMRGDFPNLKRWAGKMAVRPGVAKGMAAFD